MQQSKGGGWLGWLIFIFLVFGVRFLPPVAAWLSQVTGLTITVPMLIVAVIVGSVVVTIASSIIRQATVGRSRAETRLPTPTAPPLPPQKSGGQPPSLPRSTMPRPRLPTGEQRLPGPPRFEPIIDPRILSFGILGVVVLGAFFFVALLIAGGIP
ncbi:MAG: hypothetical protein OHK0015_04400 [Chloroflexi bacterium OHK40]